MDITIIYYTLNRLPERWVEFHKKKLLEVVGNAAILSYSAKPIDMGHNFIQEGPPSPTNMVKQILRGAKEATTTYVATVEDDTLYPPDHFFGFRPVADMFAYNLHRWSVHTWGIPLYSWKDRIGYCSMIAPRALLVETLEEWFRVNPTGELPHAGEPGKERASKLNHVHLRKMTNFYSKNALISFRHKFSIDIDQQNENKAHGQLRAFDIPYWGKAEKLIKNFQ